MNLFKQTGCFISWYRHVFKSFWRIKPGVSLFLICSALIERCCNLLAFVLPLKIVLLASAEGVPHYFRGFIPPESKPAWIIALSIAAFAFFLVSIVLNVVSERLAKIGGDEVVIVANEISVANAQAVKAKNYYSTACAIISNGVFAFLGLIAVSLLDSGLFLVVTFSLMGIYLLTSWALREKDKASKSWLGEIISGDFSGYLDFWTYGVFIAGFITLLVPFLAGASPSILFAVLAIIILRHSVIAAFSAVKGSVKLWRWKEGVDPLVFRNVHLTRQSGSGHVDLREFLSNSNRELILEENFSSTMPNSTGLALFWEDSPVKTFTSLSLRPTSEAGSEDHRFLVHVFAEKWEHLLRHEQSLVRHMDRSKLWALSEVLSFNRDGFSCQVLDVSMGERLVSKKGWHEIDSLMLRQHWSCAPPKELVSGYSGSHPLMYQRFTGGFFSPLEVAINGEQEEQMFTLFLQLLPAIRKFLMRQPLYVHNPELNSQTVVRMREGKSDAYAVETWGKWALEPVGYRLPSKYTEAQLEEVVDYLVAARKDITSKFGSEDVLLVSEMAALEGLVQVQRFSAALESMKEIMCKKHLFLEQKDVHFA